MDAKILPIVFLVIASLVPVLVYGCSKSSAKYKFSKSGIWLEFFDNSDGVEYNIIRNYEIIESFKFDKAFTSSTFTRDTNKLIFKGDDDRRVEIEIIEDSGGEARFRVSQTLTQGQTSTDCVSLMIGRTSWFGGPENRYQYWPIEKASFTNYSYVTKEQDNCALTERYWLSSSGIYIFVEDETPLFIDQNTEDMPNRICFSARQNPPYDTSSTSFTFAYQVGIFTNAQRAHLAAVRRHLKKPTGVIDERMVRHPIWSTWALYKTKINEEIVRSFSQQILQNNFNNSQLEIDDDWEECYGALTFRKSKFPDIKAFTDELKASGFRVTLWIHPFINKVCEPWYSEAKEKGYLVLDESGNPDTQWWNSNSSEAAYVDFTKPAAAEWYINRLKQLQSDAGIDSFKFDAGETSWSPKNAVLSGSKNRSPSLITSAYVRTVAQFGPMVEVRSGQGTQDLPIFVRMIDKDSEWGWNNGLVTLITTLLQMNMVGYPFVLPDMIGGNGYNDKPPNKELFIRWLQANVFMPSLQFSYVPWQYDQETVSISQEMVKLHDQYTDEIMRRVELATDTGEPINLPLWWISPQDQVARQIYDQFLLGDNIIAAPVINPGQVDRDIYLPSGLWRDGNTNKLYEGPKWLMNYPAPLNVLPFFVRATAPY